MRLEKTERVIIVSLVAALIVAFAVSASLKNRSFATMAMESFNAVEFKDHSDRTNPTYAVPPTRSTGSIERTVDKININEAGAEDLMKLKGVGKTLAAAITEYRYKKGSFASIDDIKNVKGVGVALFEKIKDKITVE